MATAFNLIKNTAKAGNTVLGVGCYSAVLMKKSNEDQVKTQVGQRSPFSSLIVQMKFWIISSKALSKKKIHEKSNENHVVVEMFRALRIDFSIGCSMETWINE